MIPLIRSRRHLDFIRELPCLRCGDNRGSDPAHIRYNDPSVNKIQGMGLKPPDWATTPLCRKCHDEQHAWAGGERNWWQVVVRIEPIRPAMALFCNSGDHEAGSRIVANTPKLLW